MSAYRSAVLWRREEEAAKARAAADAAEAAAQGITYLQRVRRGYQLDWEADKIRVKDLPDDQFLELVALLDVDGGDGRPPRLTSVLVSHAWDRLDEEARHRATDAWPMLVKRLVGSRGSRRWREGLE